MTLCLVSFFVPCRQCACWKPCAPRGVRQTLTLDHTQRLNLHALLGAQRADVGSIRAIWGIQNRISLSTDEENAPVFALSFDGDRVRVADSLATAIRLLIGDWPHVKTRHRRWPGASGMESRALARSERIRVRRVGNRSDQGRDRDVGRVWSSCRPLLARTRIRYIVPERLKSAPTAVRITIALSYRSRSDTMTICISLAILTILCAGSRDNAGRIPRLCGRVMNI